MQHGPVHGVQYDPDTIHLPANVNDDDVYVNRIEVQSWETHTASPILRKMRRSMVLTCLASGNIIRDR